MNQAALFMILKSGKVHIKPVQSIIRDATSGKTRSSTSAETNDHDTTGTHQVTIVHPVPVQCIIIKLILPIMKLMFSRLIIHYIPIIIKLIFPMLIKLKLPSVIINSRIAFRLRISAPLITCTTPLQHFSKRVPESEAIRQVSQQASVAERLHA